MSSSSNKRREPTNVSDDVLFVIFLLLPVDSLVRFRFVCKYWFNLITSYTRNPTFVQMHHQHHPPYNATTTTTYNLPTMFYTSTDPFESHYLYYSLNINASSSSSSKRNNNTEEAELIDIVYPFKTPSSQLQILGSCNGLLCIQVVDYRGAEGILCLWNPFTNEFKQVPHEPEPTVQSEYDNIGLIKVAYGFGYDRLINDYKLVRVVRFSPSYEKMNLNKAVIKVYTLGTNSWKRVDKEIPYGFVGSYSTRVGLYLNGALHWISSKDNQIYSFNIEDEEFRELPKPAECSNLIMDGAQLQVLRGCLCIFNSNTDENECEFEVWMMMDYGLQESWTKLFRATDPKWTQLSYLEPLWICKNGEVVIGNGHILMLGLLVLYDPNNDKFESIGHQGILFGKINTIVHIGSFVSLKSGTYVDQEQQLNKEGV